MFFLLLQFANLLSLMDPVVPTRYLQCVIAREVTYISFNCADIAVESCQCSSFSLHSTNSDIGASFTVFVDH